MRAYYICTINLITTLTNLITTLMKITNSKISKQIIETHRIELGEIHFLENLVVLEFDEGAHIDFNSSQEFLNLIIDFYGLEKQFGYITNRVNKFSVAPLDCSKFNTYLKNLTIFGNVAYSYLDNLNIDLEKRFCEIPYKGFNDIYSAVDWVNNYINKTSSLAS